MTLKMDKKYYICIVFSWGNLSVDSNSTLWDLLRYITTLPLPARKPVTAEMIYAFCVT